MKKILYIDIDNFLLDFPLAFEYYDEQTLKEYQDKFEEGRYLF